MTIVEQILLESEVPDIARAFVRDSVTLGWEDRTHAHGRRRTDGGIEFGTSLPRGTVLRTGHCFLLPDEQRLVLVVERVENVFVVSPRDPREWALFAYHIGNRHQPVMITDAGLVCPDAPGVEQLLQQHRMPYTRAAMPFTPVAATAGHAH
jgi:urease accessory protein